VNDPVTDFLSFFSNVPADEKAYTDNLAAIKKILREDLQFPLNATDEATLDANGLEIGFRLNGRRDGGGLVGGRFSGGMGSFPTFKDLMIETDSSGKRCSFLADEEDYGFVRSLHRKNLIIPVVGDFAGKKALAAVGDYLRKYNFTVTAFYTSNVEMVLFRGGIFDGFANNVKKLPVNDHSLIIRAAFSRYEHPARLPDYGTFTLLQQIPVFLRDFDGGLYKSYTDLINTHYISAEKP
jgi:hypothetical protein